MRCGKQQHLSDLNCWSNVVDSAVVTGSNGLRVPLSDKRDRGKKDERLPPEDRPNEPDVCLSVSRSPRKPSRPLFRTNLAQRPT